MSAEWADFRSELRADTAALRVEMREMRDEMRAGFIEIRIEMRKGFANNIRWTVAAIVGVGALGVAAAGFMLNNEKPAPVPALQPSVIIYGTPQLQVTVITPASAQPQK